MQRKARRPASFPSDDSTHYHGWDGQCWVANATAFIPAAQSGWELAAQRDGLKGKADDDYKTRTKDPQGLDPASTTFVFATLQRWAPKGRWATAKRKEGRWADVRALDADDLVHWLETTPPLRNGSPNKSVADPRASLTLQKLGASGAWRHTPR